MYTRDLSPKENKTFSERASDAKNSSTFFASNKKPAITAIKDQLLPYSCTAFSCASLFTQLLREDETDVRETNKMLRLFEIAIYYETWAKPHGLADEARSMRYLSQFCTEPSCILTEEDDIDELEPMQDHFLFMISVGTNIQPDNQPHTELITVEENKFIYKMDKLDSLGGINADIKKIIVLKKSELNIDLIAKFHHSYEVMLKSIFDSHDPNNLLHIYFLSCLIQCLDVFPEFKPLIVTLLKNAPERYLTNMGDICTVIRLMPELHTTVSCVFLQCPDKYLETMSDMVTAATTFSGREIQEAIKKVFLDSPNKYLRTIRDIGDAARYIFNGDTDNEAIKSAVLHELEDAKCTSERFYYFVEYFKQYENEFVAILFMFGQKYLQGTDNIKNAIKCFPDHKAAIIDFIDQSPSSYLTENEYKNIKELFSVDQDRRLTCK